MNIWSGKQQSCLAILLIVFVHTVGIDGCTVLFFSCSTGLQEVQNGGRFLLEVQSDEREL